MTDKEVAEWLIAIKEKYIHGGDEQYDACRREALDIAANRMKEGKQKTAYWDDTTGHWIDGDRDGTDPDTRITGEMIDTYKCSWCGFYQYWKTPFCPNCGSKMASKIQDGEQDEPVRQDP